MFSIFTAAFLSLSLQAQTAPQICGMPSSIQMTTIDQSAAEMASHVSPVVADGLNELAAFPDIQEFIRRMNPEQLCISAVVTGKNIYQYDLFLVNITMTDRLHRVRHLPLIFQAASIQAHHNFGAKPWLGFARANLVNAIRAAAGSVKFAVGPVVKSPLELLSKIFKDDETVDASSPSYMLVPDIDPNHATFLVTRLRKLDTGNPFTTEYVTDAGIVQIDLHNGQSRYAEIGGFFDMMVGFEDAQFSAAHQANDDNRLDLLEKLSL